jgi:D-glycero-D-manno-heptose 1,7-bisphosphate phosphatase
MRRAAFLDRDGVLAVEIVRNGNAYAPTRLEDFHVVQGAADQVLRLKAAGLVCVVFTNQPEVGRGLLTMDTLDSMHALLRSQVPVDDVLVCPHGADGECECRKPAPGMLHEAARRWNIALSESFVIGDRWRDIEAGRSVGCYSILLERTYSECRSADVAVGTLEAAADAVLARLEATSPFLSESPR